MNRMLIVLAIVSAVMLAACGRHAGTNRPIAEAATSIPVHDSDVGLQRCNGIAHSPYSLVAAYDSTASTVAVWTENLAGGSARGVRSPWRSYSPSMVVTVCYIDGPWAAPVPPHLPPYDRGILMVGANGVVEQGPVGYQQTMPLTRPHT